MELNQKKLVTLVASINKSGIHTDKLLTEACTRATRAAYSGKGATKYNDANYLIQNVSKRYIGLVVGFFNRYGLTVVENKGSLPVVKGVKDQSKQAKVFERMKDHSFGFDKVDTEQAAKERAEKAEASKKKWLGTHSKVERVTQYLQRAIKAAQNANDPDAEIALASIALAFKQNKILVAKKSVTKNVKEEKLAA